MNWKKKQIDELARAQVAHRIKLGRRDVFAATALHDGRILFSCTYMTAEHLARMDHDELVQLAKGQGQGSHLVASDVGIVEAIVNGDSRTLFWTVAGERTFWALGITGDLITERASDSSAKLPASDAYRYRKAMSGWYELKRGGEPIRNSDLPSQLKARHMDPRSLREGHLDEFREFAVECLVSMSESDCRPVDSTLTRQAKSVIGSKVREDPWATSRKSMAAAALAAAKASGSVRQTIAKNKMFAFPSAREAEQFIGALLEKQRYCCSLTGIPLVPRGSDLPEDAPYLPSLDRRDSDGHYQMDNLQVVCQFINKWKSDGDEGLFLELLEMVRRSPGALTRAAARLPSSIGPVDA